MVISQDSATSLPTGISTCFTFMPTISERGLLAASSIKSSLSRQQGVRRVYAEASITARPVFETHGFQVLAVQTVSLRGQTFTNYPVEKHLGASISRKRGTIDR